MTTKSIIFFFIALVAAATLHSSAAQRTHVVGDALGWLVPPGGSAAYTTWASSKTFTVGDILVFNFTTGFHDVAEVSRTAYDACNSTSPISKVTNGPANITLGSPGEHFYICTFASHCGLGQKLAINVSAASTTPAPQSAPTPPPVATPSPSPARAPETYVVGDALGWQVPPGGPIAYQTWANNKTFMVGDILVFNFTSGSHNVAELTSKAAYDSCNTSSTSTPITTSPVRITLTKPGEHFFICTFPQHCSLGQKLAINVTGTTAATPSSSPAPAPSSTARPTSSPAPAPSSTARPTSSPAPTPSSTATPPSRSATPPSGTVAPSTPGGVSAPPPPSSAPSAAAVAVPVTLLSIALALLY